MNENEVNVLGDCLSFSFRKCVLGDCLSCRKCVLGSCCGVSVGSSFGGQWLTLLVDAVELLSMLDNLSSSDRQLAVSIGYGDSWQAGSNLWDGVGEEENEPKGLFKGLFSGMKTSEKKKIKRAIKQLTLEVSLRMERVKHCLKEMQVINQRLANGSLRKVPRFNVQADIRSLRTRLQELCQDIKSRLKDGARYSSPQLDAIKEEFRLVLIQVQALNEDIIRKEQELIKYSAGDGDSTTDSTLVETNSGSLTGYNSIVLEEGTILTPMSGNVELDIAKEKMEEMRVVERQSRELREICIDVNTLLKTQGEGLDLISNGVEDSKVHVEKGVEDLEEGLKYRRAATRKCCCLWLLLLILIGGVLAFLFLYILPNRN